jgi:hypothetical protein
VSELGDAASYIFGNYEKVYEQIFGEFVFGVSGLYIDACHDGAYWHADVPEFRTLRQLVVRNGPPPSTGTKPVNFFIENPLYNNHHAERYSSLTLHKHKSG